MINLDNDNSLHPVPHSKLQLEEKQTNKSQPFYELHI